MKQLPKHPPVLILLATIVAGGISYVAQPLVHASSNANSVLINVFTILMGFLFAIMALFANVEYDTSANWRQLEVQENINQSRFDKLHFLFYLYLAVLISVFMAVLLKDSKQHQNSLLLVCLEYFYLWLASFALIVSVSLPSKLNTFRKNKFNEAIKDKRPKF
ncbi:hypothetical protein D6D69_01230 [Moraxella catarrhalis]|uniref:hypothetical protein n=1 Tax=Moraxella catarrhalis TaxID=480 RepID=UPI0007E3A0B4|nr:hypothetical protein [Moraxella catarrhalis]RKM24061.1 hypothetical protein D6D69_01230 [Moraxella catarrhalis]